MNFLARPTASLPQEHLDEYEAESPISEGWHLFGPDCEVSISSNSDGESEIFEKDCNTSEEDREAEVSAPIVGASLAQGLHYSLQDVDVFRHVKSGFCHIAKDAAVIEEDGEAVVR